MEPLVFAVGRGAMDGFPCDPTLVSQHAELVLQYEHIT